MRITVIIFRNHLSEIRGWIQKEKKRRLAEEFVWMNRNPKWSTGSWSEQESKFKINEDRLFLVWSTGERKELSSEYLEGTALRFYTSACDPFRWCKRDRLMQPAKCAIHVSFVWSSSNRIWGGIKPEPFNLDRRSWRFLSKVLRSDRFNLTLNLLFGVQARQ